MKTRKNLMRKLLTLFLILTATMSCSLFCMITFDFSAIQQPDWQEIDAAAADIQLIYDNTAQHYLARGSRTGNSTEVAAALAFMTRRKPLQKNIIQSCMYGLTWDIKEPRERQIIQLLLKENKNINPESTFPDDYFIRGAVIQASIHSNTTYLEVLLENGIDLTREIPQAEKVCAKFQAEKEYAELNEKKFIRELKQELYEGSLKVLNFLQKYQK